MDGLGEARRQGFSIEQEFEEQRVYGASCIMTWQKRFVSTSLADMGRRRDWRMLQQPVSDADSRAQCSGLAAARNQTLPRIRDE